MPLGPSPYRPALEPDGRPLDASVRAAMESRFGRDFSRVRVHSGEGASRAARELGARAFTVGRHIVMGDGQYRPRTSSGWRLLRHELAHAVQQEHFNDSQIGSAVVTESHDAAEAEARASAGAPATRLAEPAIQCERNYEPGEISAMRAGTYPSGSADTDIARRYGMAEGDLVFRLGSRVLAALIDNPVTHGGIYVGGGSVHDVVGFGNRTAPLTTFYEESADKSVVKVIRFTGPHSDLIKARVVANLHRRDFRLPSDPKPWNLFSDAGDYRTATCLEYAHAQYLYAIKQLSTDPTIDPATRASIVRTYFVAGQSEPSNLATPQTIESSHRIGDLSEVGVMMGAADTGGKNIDPRVFQNRFEGTRQIHDYGPPEGSWRRWIFPPILIETERFKSFTYRSFADSRRFFTVIR